MTPWLVRISILVGAFAFGLGCGGSDTGGGGDEIGRCASFNPLREPFFGETHAHTTLSLDAATNGTLPGPEEAYAFARNGVEIGLLLDTYDRLGLNAIGQVNLGVRKHRNRPLVELGAMSRQIVRTMLGRCGMVDSGAGLTQFRVDGDSFVSFSTEVSLADRPAIDSLRV